MAYTRNQPVASDALSTSVTYLTANTNAADDYFGVDHYAFSAASSNGLHQAVTTPAYIITPPSTIGHPTTTTYPKIYGMQDTSNVGLIQYSRGINDAVPTPLTKLQSSSSPLTLGPNSSITILDFNVIFQSGVFYGLGAGAFSCQFSSTGDNLIISNQSGNTFSNLYWTLEFLRIQT